MYCVYTGGVQQPPVITMWTSTMLSLQGTNVLLFCRADGNPSPEITWFDPDDLHITPSSSHSQYLASILQIESSLVIYRT